MSISDWFLGRLPAYAAELHREEKRQAFDEAKESLRALEQASSSVRAQAQMSVAEARAFLGAEHASPLKQQLAEIERAKPFHRVAYDVAPPGGERDAAQRTLHNLDRRADELRARLAELPVLRELASRIVSLDRRIKMKRDDVVRAGADVHASDTVFRRESTRAAAQAAETLHAAQDAYVSARRRAGSFW